MHEATPDEQRRNRWAIRLLASLTALVAAVTVAIIGQSIYTAVTPTNYQPITWKTTAVSRITQDGLVEIPQVDGYEAPSVAVGDTVPVFFDRCSDTETTFEVTADTYFHNIDTGIIYPVSENITADIEPGCIQIRIEVPMTDQMIADIKAFGDQFAPTQSTWTFGGDVNPEPAGALNSSFETTQFWIIDQ